VGERLQRFCKSFYKSYMYDAMSKSKLPNAKLSNDKKYQNCPTYILSKVSNTFCRTYKLPNVLQNADLSLV
jgi:hypothetical protein